MIVHNSQLAFYQKPENIYDMALSLENSIKL